MRRAGARRIESREPQCGSGGGRGAGSAGSEPGASNSGRAPLSCGRNVPDVPGIVQTACLTMDFLQLDVAIWRGDFIESKHRVHASVVAEDGTMLAAARDGDLVTWWRSCAKPFQAMTLLESGGFDSLGWSEDQIALACASHGGEPEHVEVVAGMLNEIGLEEGDLACGPHDPLTSRGARLLRESGARPTRLHNNCSGKHAFMLANAHIGELSLAGYERRGHPVQEAAAEGIARWSGLPRKVLNEATDGCGVVVFGMPLRNMALAYARLAGAFTRDEEVPSRIVDAIRDRPFLFAGTDRFDTVLLEASGGRVLAKIGAEGVHSAAVLDAGIGVAVKVEDGSPRAQYPALLRALQYAGALSDPLPPRLQEMLCRPVRNSRGEVVGKVELIAR